MAAAARRGPRASVAAFPCLERMSKDPKAEAGEAERAMARTKGRIPIDINERVSVGGGVHAYFDGIGLWLTFADPLSDEMSHICLSASAFEEVVRFAKDRVGGDFAAVVARVAQER